MKKLVFLLSVLFLIVLLFGCTSTNNSNENLAVTQKWSDEVSALGEPTYEKVNISPNYEILPFPGLTYSGLRDGWQAFYASNSDYTFAIYASPEIINNVGTYEEIKESVKEEFSQYSNSVICKDISTNGWLTNAKAFSCTYTYSDYISYNIVTFYKNNSYIQTNLSVWGTTLGTYTNIFNEFNEKAVIFK